MAMELGSQSEVVPKILKDAPLAYEGKEGSSYEVPQVDKQAEIKIDQVRKEVAVPGIRFQSPLVIETQGSRDGREEEMSKKWKMFMVGVVVAVILVIVSGLLWLGFVSQR